MHIKNSILVLTKVAPHFPLDYAHGSKLDASVTSLLAAEKREDLKILAQGYKAVLTKRRKEWVNRPAVSLCSVPCRSIEDLGLTCLHSPISLRRRSLLDPLRPRPRNRLRRPPLKLKPMPRLPPLLLPRATCLRPRSARDRRPLLPHLPPRMAPRLPRITACQPEPGPGRLNLTRSPSPRQSRISEE